MINRKPRFDTFEDFTRYMLRVLTLLYFLAVIALLIKWYLEGGPIWPYIATSLVMIPCMVLGYKMGIPRARYLFDAARKKYTLPRI